MVANFKVGMVRGDTAAFKFERVDNDGNVITKKADEAYFTVKTSYKDRGFVLQKTLSQMEFDEDGTYHFTIAPEDTNKLGFGTYVYDLEVIQSRVKSTISRGNFILGYESTWAINEGGNNG